MLCSIYQYMYHNLYLTKIIDLINNVPVVHKLLIKKDNRKNLLT